MFRNKKIIRKDNLLFLLSLFLSPLLLCSCGPRIRKIEVSVKPKVNIEREIDSINSKIANLEWPEEKELATKINYSVNEALEVWSKVSEVLLLPETEFIWFMGLVDAVCELENTKYTFRFLRVDEDGNSSGLYDYASMEVYGNKTGESRFYDLSFKSGVNDKSWPTYMNRNRGLYVNFHKPESDVSSELFLEIIFKRQDGKTDLKFAWRQDGKLRR